LFNQLVLADEINRATPKAQSALLEATLGSAGSALLNAIRVFDFELALSELRSARKNLPRTMQAAQEAG